MALRRLCLVLGLFVDLYELTQGQRLPCSFLCLQGQGGARPSLIVWWVGLNEQRSVVCAFV